MLFDLCFLSNNIRLKSAKCLIEQKTKHNLSRNNLAKNKKDIDEIVRSYNVDHVFDRLRLRYKLDCTKMKNKYKSKERLFSLLTYA